MSRQDSRGCLSVCVRCDFSHCCDPEGSSSALLISLRVHSPHHRTQQTRLSTQRPTLISHSHRCRHDVTRLTVPMRQAVTLLHHSSVTTQRERASCQGLALASRRVERHVKMSLARTQLSDAPAVEPCCLTSQNQPASISSCLPLRALH